MSLLKDQQTFFTDPDESSYLNYITKPNLKMNVDYKVVDQEVWNFFYIKYGGTVVKRYFRKAYSFGPEVEAKLKEIKVAVLPTLEEWDKSKIPSAKSIYASKHDKFEDLIHRIINIMNKSYKMNLTEQNIRFWKLGYSEDFDKVNDQIIQARDSQDSQMDVEKQKEDSKGNSTNIESNTGVQFPGSSLQAMKSFKLDDIELSTNDTLIVERASNKTGKFLFYYEELKILRYGKCEYCYSQKPLVVQCRCEEVQY